MPKVTVLMPIYNTDENMLRETINSILGQTFRDFEFLIINDASSKPLAQVVAEFDDPRIVYVENDKNLGIAETSNKGISLAKGEYIARQDHDDVSLPERLEKQVAFLDAYPEYGVVGCQVLCFPKGKKICVPCDDEDIKIRTVVEGAGICHPAAMIRKSVLLENNIKYHDEYRYAEDYQLWVELLNKTKFCNLPELLFKYRWFGGNTSLTTGNLQAVNGTKAKLNAVKEVLPDASDVDLALFAKMYAKQKFSLSEMQQMYGLLAGAEVMENWKKEVLKRWLWRALRQTKAKYKKLAPLWKGSKLQPNWLEKLKLRWRKF